MNMITRRYKIFSTIILSIMVTAFVPFSKVFSAQPTPEENKKAQAIVAAFSPEELEDIGTQNGYLQQLPDLYQQKFGEIMERLVLLINNMSIDNYTNRHIEKVKSWIENKNDPSLNTLKDTLDALLAYDKIRFYCDSIGFKVDAIKQEMEALQAAGDKTDYEAKKKNFEEAEKEYRDLTKQFNMLVSAKSKTSTILELKGKLIELRNNFDNVNPTCLPKVKEEAKRILTSLDNLFAGMGKNAEDVKGYIKRALEAICNCAEYSKSLYDGLNASGGGGDLRYGFCFIQSIDNDVCQIKKILETRFEMNLNNEDAAKCLKLLELFCAFNNKSEEERAKQKESEHKDQARKVCTHLELFLKSKQCKDKDVLHSAENLKKMFDAVIAGDSELMMRVIIASVKVDVVQLQSDLALVIKVFADAQKDPSNKEKCEAYAWVGERLCLYQRSLKIFDDFYEKIKSSHVLANDSIVTGISWLTEFYGYFHKCAQDDQTDKSINKAGVAINASTGLLWAFRAVNLVSGYYHEIKLLTHHRLKPVIVDSRMVSEDPDFASLKKMYSFLNNYASDSSGGMAGLLGCGIRGEAVYNVLSGPLAKMAEDSVFSGMFGMMKKVGIGREAPGFSQEIKQRIFKMFCSAVYYNMGRSYFFEGATSEGWIPKSYRPWKEASLEILSLGKQVAQIEVQKLMAKVFDLGKFEKVSQWTLGVVSPDLVNEGVSLAIDLSLTNDTVKSFLGHVVDYGFDDICGDWLYKVKAQHPKLTSGQIRALHTEKTVVAHISKCAGAFAGKCIGRCTGGIITAIGHALAKSFLPKEHKFTKPLPEIVHVIIRDDFGGNLEAFLCFLYSFTARGLTVITPDEGTMILRDFLNHEDLPTSVKQIVEKVPANVFGQLGAFLGGQFAPGYGVSYWTDHVAKTGKSMFIPFPV